MRRVVRGGGWSDGAPATRSVFRGFDAPGASGNELRLAGTLP